MNPAIGAAGCACVTVMLIDDVAGAPPLSVADTVMTCAPTVSVLAWIDAPVPSDPLMLEFH